MTWLTLLVFAKTVLAMFILVLLEVPFKFQVYAGMDVLKFG